MSDRGFSRVALGEPFGLGLEPRDGRREALSIFGRLRHAGAMLEVTHHPIGGEPDDPADHIVEGLVLAIEEIPKQPLLNQVFAGDNNSPARRAVWNSPAIVDSRLQRITKRFFSVASLACS